MRLVRRRTWLAAGLAALALGMDASAVAQQPAPGAAATPQSAQPPGGAEQPRRGGGGGRPLTAPLGDGPWDVATEQGRLHVTVVAKELDHPWGLAFLPNGDMLVT